MPQISSYDSRILKITDGEPMKRVNLTSAGLAALAVVLSAGVHAQDAAEGLSDTKCYAVTLPKPFKHWELTVRADGAEIVGGSITGGICRHRYKVTGGTLTESSIDLTAKRKHARDGCAPLTLSGVATVPGSYSGTFHFDAPDQYTFDAKLHACQ
jgi:hypothetical protein